MWSYSFKYGYPRFSTFIQLYLLAASIILSRGVEVKALSRGAQWHFVVQEALRWYFNMTQLWCPDLYQLSGSAIVLEFPCKEWIYVFKNL